MVEINSDELLQDVNYEPLRLELLFCEDYLPIARVGPE